MSMSEPPAWTRARQQRLAAQFPEFTVGDADSVIGTDGYRSVRGEPVSSFSQAVMRLALAAAEERQQ